MKWSGEVYVEARSDKALLVVFEGEKIWVPKSVIDDDSEVWSDKHVGQTGDLVLPEWLADEKGLT